MKILIEDLLVPEISDILYKRLNSIYKSAKDDLYVSDVYDATMKVFNERYYPMFKAEVKVVGCNSNGDKVKKLGIYTSIKKEIREIISNESTRREGIR